MLLNTITPRHERQLRLVAASLLCAGLLYCFRWAAIGHNQSPIQSVDGRHHASQHKLPAPSDSSILETLGVLGSFEFQRFCVIPREREGLERQVHIDVTKEIFTGNAARTLQPLDVTGHLPACSTEITLDVAGFQESATDDTGALILGIATKLDRVEASLNEMQRWISRTNTRLLVLVVDTPEFESDPGTIASIRTLAAKLEIDMVLKPHDKPDDSEGLKNFGLAEPLLAEARRRPGTRWVGVIDDDTFIVSLPQLIARLDTFDHSKQMYVGQLSEGWTRISHEGMKAWGGAGIFLSLPLLHELVKHSDECKALNVWFGDVLWRDCIFAVTAPTVRLSRLEGLNQMDIWRDPSGWYESGQDVILTVHHWKSWHFHPVPMAHLVTDIAGPDSFLQRYLFTEDQVVLTNGYSLVHYPKQVPDLRLMELTMVEDVGIEQSPEWQEFHESYGRTRPALPREDKVSWMFTHAAKDMDGNVRQFYVRKTDETTSVVELDWIAST